jgi:hypothetical protein
VRGGWQIPADGLTRTAPDRMPAIGLAKTTRFKSGISNPNTVDFLPEILLLAVVADDLAEAAVQALKLRKRPRLEGARFLSLQSKEPSAFERKRSGKRRFNRTPKLE